MKTKYNNHDIEVIYSVEPEYWTFYLKIQVNGAETLRSMTYELPRALKIFSWVIEDVPVHIAIDALPYVEVRWDGIAIGMNVKEIVNIQPALDYINIYLS